MEMAMGLAMGMGMGMRVGMGMVEGGCTGNENENGARRHVATDCSVLSCCHFVFGLL